MDSSVIAIYFLLCLVYLFMELLGGESLFTKLYDRNFQHITLLDIVVMLIGAPVLLVILPSAFGVVYICRLIKYLGNTTLGSINWRK